MKPKVQLLPFLAIALLTPALQAGTVNATFSFQQGDLQKDAAPYGSGASYNGGTSGHITDANTSSALTSGETAILGNQFRNTDPLPRNGQNYIGLYAYDLTELNDFITANTSSSSSVTVTSVSFKLVASGSTVGTSNGTISLFRTDPFTTAATWATTDGSTAWTVPYQNLSDETQYKYTGGGSALTVNLGGTSPTTASKTAGSPIEWTTSANFVSAINAALAEPDKKLHLMAARALGNADGRVAFHTSSAATVDDRPELVISVAINTFSDWTGASNDSWATAGNWTTPPASGDNVRFNSSSTANLATVLNQDFNLNGLALINPAGPVSIGGANSLTVGAGGMDLSAATQNLTVTAPLILGATQTWNVAADRTLGISSAITGSGDLTVFGAGKVLLNAANILPNGAGTGNLNVTGTLDLNGFSQSVNALTGSGVVDNTAAGASVLTVGNNNAAGPFSGLLRDTGTGTLALIKTGSGGLTLTGASDYSGGFTNDGSGSVAPNSDGAFGSGPVVSNAGTLYPTTTRIFGNTLALNNSTLRIGGGGTNTITWNGAVTATGASGINADGGTGGITLGSTLNIAGATFTSFANGTTHKVLGDISGASGNLSITSGTLELSGANSYTGTTTLSGSAVLRLQPTGTISSSSNIVINGTANFNVRNTVGWVYSGTITGEGTGQINLNTGTNAEIAGNISGVATVTAASTGTDTTVSGDISGPAAVNVQSSAILRLSGANTYSGATTLTGGTLVFAASNVLPDATPVSIGNATLNAVTFTDTAGTLDVTNAASTINLGTGATLAFADSSAVAWTGGTLNITGIFVSGSSLRFGTTAAGLTDEQLLQITSDGFTGFDLDAAGFLTAAAGTPYDIWKTQITNGLNLRTDDADGDGFINLDEFLYGSSPIAGNGSLVSTTAIGGNLVLRWLQRESGANYTLKQSSTLDGGSWTTVVSPVPAMDGDQSGAPTDYDYYTVTLPTSGGKLFFRIEGLEN